MADNVGGTYYGESSLGPLASSARNEFNKAEGFLKELGLGKGQGGGVVAGDGGGAGGNGNDLGTMQELMMNFNLAMSKGEVKKGAHKQGTEQIKGVGQKMN